MVYRVISIFRDRKSLLVLTGLLCVASITVQAGRSFAGLNLDVDLRPGGEAAEHYFLPITAPLDQGDTGLCWVYAALSMLETNYLYRHPGSHLVLSRGDLQLDAIAGEIEFDELVAA